MAMTLMLVFSILSVVLFYSHTYFISAILGYLALLIFLFVNQKSPIGIIITGVIAFIMWIAFIPKKLSIFYAIPVADSMALLVFFAGAFVLAGVNKNR